MSRLDEIKEEVIKKNDYMGSSQDGLTDSDLKDIAEQYARECISATVKKITDENAYHVNTSEDGVVHCVEVCDILDSDNFVML